MEEDESSHTEPLEQDLPATIPVDEQQPAADISKSVRDCSLLSKVEQCRDKARQSDRQLFHKKQVLRRNFTDGDRLALDELRTNPNLSVSIGLTQNNAYDSTRFLAELDLSEVTSINFRNTGITSLEGFVCPMPKLTTIWLEFNLIRDVSGLLEGRFDQLQDINLTGNQLSNLDVLKNVGPAWRQLYLSNNRINSLEGLCTIDLRNLKLLAVNQNTVSDISCLRRVDFKTLRSLHLDNNQIMDCSDLAKVDFRELKTLILSHNDVCDLGFLSRMLPKKLKLLDLSYNHICDIRQLLRNRIFAHVYLVEYEDFFPGCYVPENKVNTQYYDSISDVLIAPDSLGYIITPNSLETVLDELEMKYPREGESDIWEGQGGEEGGQEDGVGGQDGQGGEDGEGREHEAGEEGEHGEQGVEEDAGDGNEDGGEQEQPQHKMEEQDEDGEPQPVRRSLRLKQQKKKR